MLKHRHGRSKWSDWSGFGQTSFHVRFENVHGRLSITSKNQSLKARQNILKMNKEVGMLLPKKIANTSGVGISNNYYEDIYIHPYNTTH